MADFGGRYRKVRLLGAGGMGEVWLALDEELDERPVAIKWMHPRMLADADDVARFQREMRLAARMHHPNIMTVFTTGTDHGVPFMVMEYLEGRDLSKATRGWSADQVARIGQETYAALAYAHSLGVVHRDIKPGNLFLCATGQVKVTDFGIAKAISGTSLTATGTLLGTFPYMAPEQWLGEPAAFSNDIWATGCVLYELLSGQLPRTYASPTDYVSAAARRETVPPLRPNASTPAWLAGAVMTMLEPDPRRRPSAAECARLLSGPSALSAVPTETAVSDPRSAAPRPGRTSARQQVPGRQPPRRRRRPVIVVGAAGVAVIAAVTGLLLRSAPPAWATMQAPLPGNAAIDTSDGAQLNDVACPSAGSCVAVGDYPVDQNGAKVTKPLVDTLSHGTWTASGDVPGDAADTEFLFGIACLAAGSCVAVGDYLARRDHPIAATLSDGSWTVTDMPLPGNADQDTNAFLHDVACPVQGTCIATGDYTDQNGDDEALIESLSGGKWTARPAPLPAGAIPVKAAQPTNTILVSAACPAEGSCIAVGQYTTRGGGAASFIETLSGSNWTPATMPLPADAPAGKLGGLYAISCPAPGKCLAVGQYENRSAQARPLGERLSDGTWTAAAPPLPDDASATQEWHTQQSVTGLNAVTCQASGSCLAGGSYIAGSATVGAIDTLSGETWSAARAPLPPGAATTKQYFAFSSALCPASGNCVAVGAYKMADGTFHAFIETATGDHG